MGGGGLQVEDVSGTIRMLAYFYICSYFLGKTEKVKAAGTISVFVIGVSMIFLYVSAPQILGSGRLSHYSQPNVSARNILAALIIVCLVLVNKKVFSTYVRGIAKIELLFGVFLILSTGSRQVIFFGLLPIFLGAYLITPNINKPKYTKVGGSVLLLSALSFSIVVFAQNVPV